MARKINFLDISVYDRGIASVDAERATTAHSIGYLDHLDDRINCYAVRFGAKRDAWRNWRIFTYSLSGLLQFCGHMRSIRPDFVLFHSFRFPIRFLLLKWLLPDTKFIVQHHAGNPSPNAMKRAVQSFCYAKSDHFNFVTRHQAGMFYRAGIIRDDAQILETMVGSTAFRLLDKEQCRTELALPASVFTIIWVGHLNNNKDPMTLMRALASVHEAGLSFRLLMFYGQDALLWEARAFAQARGFAQSVSFKGQVENGALEKWLNASDCYVSCSHSEGSGIALAEALACGCLPVVTRIPSFNSMTPRPDLQFAVGDDRGLYAGLRSAMETHFDQRHANRKFFEERLSFEAIARSVSAWVIRDRADDKS